MKLTFWQKIQFYFLWWTCRLIGLLPERVLYEGLGGLVHVVLYRIVRYRLKVVRENLAHSFPGKSEAERREIELTHRKMPSQFLATRQVQLTH